MENAAWAAPLPACTSEPYGAPSVGASVGTGGMGARSSVTTKAEGAGAGGAGSSSGSAGSTGSTEGESPGAQTR